MKKSKNNQIAFSYQTDAIKAIFCQRYYTSVRTTTMCQLGWARSDRVFHQQPLLPSFFNPSWDKEREGEREAEILLQGIHLITETELIAS